MIYKTLHRKLKIEHYLCGTFSIYISVADLEGGVRGVRGVRPPKIRKSYVIQR
jgi:hypothetical protein